MLKLKIWLRDRMSSFRSILIGFFFIIMLGAVLLSLPEASADGVGVPFLNALFTSASASCVTGLVVYDTAMQWSLFGKAVILVLIQIGGLGVITMIVLPGLIAGRNPAITQLIAMKDTLSAPHIGGIEDFTRFFLRVTIFMEALGAALLMPVFCREFGFLQGTGYAVFHSVSAFCNAGFDLMGIKGEFSSLTSYASQPWVNLVIIGLIVVGGLGFFTWRDMLNTKFEFRRFTLQSKLILTATAILLAIPFLFFFLIEFRHMPMQERVLTSLFQAVTPRTAGFNTADYGTMSESGLLMTILLMITGGAPGSTAGGMKVTTIAVMTAMVRSFMKGKEHVNVYKRRIPSENVHNAFVLVILYLGLLLTGTVLISGAERLPVIISMFECASALGTVGLTTGITSGLSSISKLILIMFMYFGRVGGLTLIHALSLQRHRELSKLPAEKINVG